MIDVKKLVTGFLVLAVAASASALLISTIGPNHMASTGTTSGAIETQPSGTLAGNAFLPQSDNQNSDAVLTADDPTASTTDAIMGDPNNLTNILTSAYMNNLVSANPDGPSADTNGNPTLTPPNNESVITQFVNSSTVASIQTPNWDVEAAGVPVMALATSSATAVANYSSAIESIFNQDFVQPNLDSMLNQNTDPSAASYVAPKIQSALRDVAGLRTPTPLVSFQKSLIKLLVYEKNIITLAANISSSSDPLKTALILQDEQPKYNSAIQSFQNELGKATAATGFAPFALNGTPAPQNGVVALINNMLGIKTAHAIFGLGDITFDPTAFAQTLLEYANNIALQILKNLVMSLMQKTVLKWVQGNGAPRFIQNWGTTLVNAFTQTAIGALNSQMLCIGSAPFAAQLKLTLGATYKPNNNVCAVQFQSQLGNNLSKFYNNFSNGGWLTFGSTLQPDNNYYGSIFFTAQAVGNTAQNARNAAQAKAIGNQGWNGTEVCRNGKDPNTGCNPGDFLNANLDCQSKSGGTYAPQGGGGTCSDGSTPTILQPGQVTGQVFNSAVDSSGKLTAAANDVAGLLDAFLSSLLNSIATEAITAASGALNGLNNGGGGGGGGGAGGSNTGQVPISCTATLQNANVDIVTFIGSGGQTISGTNAGTTNTSVPSYSWAATNGTPAAGVGGQFTTTFPGPGTYTANITDVNPADGGVSTQCDVTIE